jgi:RNA polymerase sigma-70 factor, ECF subfamily
MANTDADLVYRVQQGDQRAFAMLLARHERPIYNLACRMVHDADDAADIVQSTFVKVYVNLHRYDPARSFFSWLYRIALNECLTHRQRRQRSRSLPAGPACAATTPEDDFQAAEANAHLQRALLAMTYDQRVVVVLKHLLQLSYEEIAGILEVPEQTVKSRLYTARQILRQILVKQGYAG